MSVSGTGTPGGARLRALRRQAGKTQLEVEFDADLGSGYLQRVESGKVAQPGPATLERILTALESRYSERREVLEMFGYAVTVPPPDADDIAWAREICQDELRQAVFPAYVVDCATRLIVWNQYVPCLFGVETNEPLLDGLTKRSLLASWFDPSSPLAPLVVEPDVFLPAMIRAFRHELQQVRGEEWAASLLAELTQSLPYFRRYWEKVESEPEPASATRVLAPVRLAVPDVGVLQFRLTTEPFTRDRRFRMVYYLPADPVTMRQCATWAVHGD